MSQKSDLLSHKNEKCHFVTVETRLCLLLSVDMSSNHPLNKPYNYNHPDIVKREPNKIFHVSGRTFCEK